VGSNRNTTKTGWLHLSEEVVNLTASAQMTFTEDDTAVKFIHKYTHYIGELKQPTIFNFMVQASRQGRYKNK